MSAVITARIVEKSIAARIPIIAAINTQTDATNEMMPPTSGTNPRMRNTPRPIELL